MNNDLFFDGKKYISSKRVSEITGYTSDYIGELCRDGRLDCRMVGRAWFVTVESVKGHQSSAVIAPDTQKGNSAVSKTALPSSAILTDEVFSRAVVEPSLPRARALRDAPSSPASTSKGEFFFDGKRYVSSKRASRLTGYARDYIGELCRDGRLDCRMVGRAWFVTVESIKSHQKSSLAKTPVSSASVTTSSVVPVSSVAPVAPKSVITPAKAQVSSSPAKVFPLPVLNKKTSGSDQPSPVFLPSVPSPYTSSFRKRAVAVLAVLVLLLGSYGGVKLFRLDPGASPVVRTESRNFAVDWYRFIQGTFIGIGKFFAERSGTERFAISEPVYTDRRPISEGLVVMPDTQDGREQIDRIRNVFSDQVSVAENEDGISGVITPVFRKVAGDDYLYVIVPVNE